MPTWPRPSKNTRSPGWSWSRETGLPIPYCAYELCGSETPTCANTYITSPEQSKPDGDAPPQRYGTPRYCSAIETTLECVGGGAGPTETLPLEDATGATVLESAWAGACCCWATIRVWSSRRSWAWRAASCACRFAIWPRIDESIARRADS